MPDSPAPQGAFVDTPAQLRCPSPQLLELSGRLDADACQILWDHPLESGAAKTVVLDLSGITHLDTAGAVFIRRLIRQYKTNDVQLEPRGLPTAFATLLAPVLETPDCPPEPGRDMGQIQRAGRGLHSLLTDTTEFIRFTGELLWTLGYLARHPGQIRIKEILTVAERAGVNALPIVALISFIVGLVMAFQSAVPMKMFGAELYVANLIGMAMVRELGPLMTAIVLAGRSASAFAAEIGTMKINEELDALTVMGLDPMQVLILPRVLASTLITPLLTVFANLMGILGGAVVILSFDYPLVAYTQQVVSFVTWVDFVGGLVKCFVFGVLIAATGCLRGYHTGRGPSAVGEATTSAVVTCIVLIAVFDGIFSIIYYRLGI